MIRVDNFTTVPLYSGMPLQTALSDQLVELIAERFRTMGEPVRIRIMQQLCQGEASVQDLADHLGSSQQNISKHLGLLPRAGNGGLPKAGTNANYRIIDESVLAMCEQVCGSVQRQVQNLTAAVQGIDR